MVSSEFKPYQDLICKFEKSSHFSPPDNILKNSFEVFLKSLCVQKFSPLALKLREILGFLKLAKITIAKYSLDGFAFFSIQKMSIYL